MYRTISVCVAFGLLGLAASASANLVTNGDFEADLGSTVGTNIANFTQSVSGWFEKNDTTRGDALQWDGTGNTDIPDDADGEVWAILNTSQSGHTPANSPGAFYQSIGTYSDNMQVLVALTVGQRVNLAWNDVIINLYSGNVTGADGSSLSGLGATLLDSYTIDDTVFSGPGVAEAVTLQNLLLDTGTSGVAGETLWIEFAAFNHGVDSPNQALIDDIVVSDGVVTWTGSGNGYSLFDEANWDAAGGVLSGDYVSKTGTTPYDLVIDIAGSVGGSGGWDGTLDLDGTGSLTVTNDANYFRMNTSGNATLKNGTAWFRAGNANFDFQGTFDNMDVYVNGGTDLAGSLDLINGSTFDTTWFAFGGICDLDGGSILTIRQDESGSFIDTTVNFLDLDSRIVYSNTGRTVAEVTTDHLSHFLVDGVAAVLNSNIYVDKESSTGQTIVRRSRQVTWSGANGNGYFFQNGNWDVDDVVKKDPDVCTINNRDLVIDISGAYTIGGGDGINGTLDLNHNSSLIVTNSADSFKMATDGSLVIKNGTAWFKSGTEDFDFEGTFDNMDVYVNWGTDLAGSLDLINGSTFDTTWFAFGEICDIDGGSTLTIREDESGSFTGTTVNFLDLDSKIVYSNTGREVAEVTSQHLSQFTVNGTAASVGVNINVFTDPGTGYTTVQAIPRGTIFRFR